MSDPDIAPDEPMPLECLTAFKCLWDDKGVQMAMLKGNEYALHDNLSLYANRNLHESTMLTVLASSPISRDYSQ